MSGLAVHRAPDLASVARSAAEAIAERARAAVDERGRCTLALSGGSTPWAMLEILAGLDVPWPHVHLLQVDERAAEDGHPDRNWTRIEDSFLGRVGIPREQCYAMPVGRTAAGDEAPADSAAAYDESLRRACGASQGEAPTLDIVQLGLGGDGHTASLVPGDDVLEVTDADIAWTRRAYQGRRRMTMTYPLIDRARSRLWLVAGAGKASAVRRLLAADESIPAGRVSTRPESLVFADSAALGS